MKFFLFFCLFLSQLTFAQMDSIFVDGLYRKYLVHLPPAYDGTMNLPVVLGFHGALRNAEQFESQSKISVKADAENFIAIYPDGLGYPDNPSFHFWNAGPCCGYAFENDIDDINFIGHLLDTLSNDFMVDTNRIYATGMSNGAFLCYDLACEFSDKIAAIAPVSGGMLVESCNPERSVPIISFFSHLDEIVPPTGGPGSLSPHHNPPIDSVFNAWSIIGNCTNTNDTLYNGTDYTNVVWNNCDCFTEIDFYITQDGGHSWPGGNVSVFGAPVSEAVNATDLIWDFFETYSLNCHQLSVKEEYEILFTISPNPIINSVLISSEQAINSVKLFNQLGQEIAFFEFASTTSIKLDLSMLKNGIYIAKIKTQDSFSNQRIVIQH